jgi:hypothetical protein
MGYKNTMIKPKACSSSQAEHVSPRPTSLHAHTSGNRQTNNAASPRGEQETNA